MPVLLDSNKITSRSSQTVPTDSLSLSLSLGGEKRETIASRARITRAPADRKLPLIASQTFILHPEYPRLSPSLSLYVFRLNPSPLSLIGFRFIIPVLRSNEHDLQKQTPLCHVERNRQLVSCSELRLPTSIYLDASPRVAKSYIVHLEWIRPLGTDIIRGSSTHRYFPFLSSEDVTWTLSETPRFVLFTRQDPEDIDC